VQTFGLTGGKYLGGEITLIDPDLSTYSTSGQTLKERPPVQQQLAVLDVPLLQCNTRNCSIDTRREH
jgi:hypothetical protein